MDAPRVGGCHRPALTLPTRSKKAQRRGDGSFSWPTLTGADVADSLDESAAPWPGLQSKEWNTMVDTTEQRGSPPAHPLTLFVGTSSSERSRDVTAQAGLAHVI